MLNVANAVCAAARTAPKACRIDHLDTAVLTGENKDALAAQMRKIGESFANDGKFFLRDADMLGHQRILKEKVLKEGKDAL